MTATRSTVSSDDMALDLSRLLQAIGSALKWLLPLVVVVAGIFFLALQFVPSKYKSQGKVLIESTDARFPGAARGVEEQRAVLDTEGVASQVQLLTSADLARRVAKTLDLASVPEFGAAEGGSLIDETLAMLGIGKDMSQASAEEKVLKHYYENLQVYRLEGSRVIAVEYSSQDAELSANVANTVLDEYVALQASAKRETTEDAAASMEPQIADLRREVQAARKAVEDFRARNDLLVGTGNITLNQQQLADLSSKYSEAQANKAEAQAKADLIREILKSGGSLDGASDVLNSQLIQRLREQQVAIQSKYAELSITHLSNHPQLKALKSQLTDYDRQIRSEARKVLTGLENDAKVASQQAAALERRLDELKASAARSGADQVRLTELEREANSKAAQLDKLVASFREADMRLRAQALPADARIISRASIPLEPYAPKVIAITIISALVTFVLGSTFVVMREFLAGHVLYPVEDGRRPVPQQVEMNRPEPEWGRRPVTTEYSPYSFSGTFSGYDRKSSDTEVASRRDTVRPEDTDMGRSERLKPARRGMAHDPDIESSRLPEEAAEEMDAQIEDAAFVREFEDALDGHVVVLSVDDGAAAEELSFNLARHAAAEGRSVLYLEVFPEQADPDVAPGFADLVAGDVQFAKTIYRDTQSRVHIIEAGQQPIGDELAASKRFRSVLDAVARTYDTIVINLGTIDGTLASARLLGFADLVLVTAADGGYGKELASAANLLAHNTGARVRVVETGADGAREMRRGAA